MLLVNGLLLINFSIIYSIINVSVNDFDQNKIILDIKDETKQIINDEEKKSLINDEIKNEIKEISN